MKKMRRVLALALAMVMVLGTMSMSAWAAPTGNSHTVTIKNTDQNVPHTYKIYQIFSGNLNAEENKLSDIQWGSGVDGEGLLVALKASTNADLKGDDPLTEAKETDANIFNSCTTAQDVAKVLATLSSTATFTTSTRTLDGTNESAGAIDAVADIIGGDPAESGSGFLTNVAKADADGTTDSAFTADQAGTSYTATVFGDGYYFIKDTTEKLQTEEEGETKSDTAAKYMLSVIRDETIIAKDTGFAPDKKILDAQNGTATTTKVAADSSAIGDTVTFDVEVVVPNTKKYQDHFWFVMKDQLPEGITFTGITSVKVGDKTLIDTSKASPAAPISDTAYTDAAAENGYYTLKVTNADDSVDNYAWEATNYDAVKEAGGQTIELTFNQFKKFVEVNNLIGQQVVVKYTGVVNDDAKYQATANENEVKFDYSNNPNHDYNGDNPGPDDDEVTGTTPGSKTRTYTTSFKILKVKDDETTPLEGATFKLTGTSLNRTVLTGTKFVTESYTPTNGEEVDSSASYWKLKDGSYTTTDPTTVANTTQYESTTIKYFKVTYDYDEVTPNEAKVDIEIVTGADGVAQFTGLREGTYYLEETAAPDGYNKIDGVSKITITWSDPEADDATSPAKDQGGFILTEADAGQTLTADDGTAYAGKKTVKFNIAWKSLGETDNDKQFEAKIVNKSGSVLPSTGGIGTTMFYVVGAILVIGAGVLLVSRKRMNLR